MRSTVSAEASDATWSIWRPPQDANKHREGGERPTDPTNMKEDLAALERTKALHCLSHSLWSTGQLQPSPPAQVLCLQLATK